MPSFRDIVYGIYGAWRLACRDPGAMTYFERTVEGFWKSFFAAVLIAPGHAIIVVLNLSEVETSIHPVSIVTIEFFTYVITLVAFPLASFYVIQNIGRASRFVGYIVAFNWSSVIQLAIFLPFSLLAVRGVLPDAITNLIGLAAFIVIMGYKWFITRTALDITGFPAVGLVLLGLVIELIVRGITDSIIM